MIKWNKRTEGMVMTVAGAAGFAWLTNTFPGGDSLLGLVWGSLWGHPVLGLVTGAVVPNRQTTEDIRRAIEAEKTPLTPATLPQSGSIQGTLGDWTILARYYRDQATEASARGDTTSARDAMRLAEQADMMATEGLVESGPVPW